MRLAGDASKYFGNLAAGFGEPANIDPAKVHPAMIMAIRRTIQHQQRSLPKRKGSAQFARAQHLGRRDQEARYWRVVLGELALR